MSFVIHSSLASSPERMVRPPHHRNLLSIQSINLQLTKIRREFFLRQQHLINHDNSKYESRNLCRSAHALNMLLSRDKSSASSYAFSVSYLLANCHISVSTAVFTFSANTFLSLICRMLMLIRWHFYKMDGHVTLDYLHFSV